MKLTHIDLFSGIGGFALAARWVGFETVQFVEIDPFCQKVLAKNFKGVPIHDDIKTFTYAEQQRWGQQGNSSANRNEEEVEILHRKTRPFLLTGGFPCQPFSAAGKRRGTDDNRHLWPEMLRVIREFQPAWIIGENVGGILSMAEFDSESEMGGQADIFGDVSQDVEKRGRGILYGIIRDLEQIGYAVQAFVIPACAVGAPHRRDRVWIVGYSASERSGGGCENGGGFKAGLHRERIEQVESDRHAPDTDRFNGNNAGYDAGEVSQLKKAEVCGLHNASDTDRQGPQGYGQYGECAGERLIGQGAWQEPWIEAATRLCRVDDGIPNRVDRLKCLGNAIVPQVAYQIMKAIIEDENGS